MSFHHYDRVFIENHSQKIDVRWIDNNRLLIEHTGIKRNILKKDMEKEGIFIHYLRK